MATVSLTEFLLAQLDADEAAVNSIRNVIAASPGSYATIGLDHPELAAGDCPSFLGDYDPERVLAHITAVRVVVELHAHDEDERGRRSCGECDFGNYTRQWCPTLRALAQPYAGRAGWDAGWGL